MTQEWRFWNSMRVTLTYAVGMATIPYCLALPLALFLNMQFRGRAAFRTLFFLPVVTPVSAAGLVFVYLFSTDFGAVNAALIGLHLIDKPINPSCYLGHCKVHAPSGTVVVSQPNFPEATWTARL